MLVQQTDRRNAENIAESIEGATPRSLQRLLTESPWSCDPVIGALQGYVGERLNTSEGVFVVDDTGFEKKGRKSVGVARQYSGTLGKVDNCQVGVFLAYVSERGHALVDKKLYLPREWTEYPQRCEEAGVPEDVEFQTKAELALEMLRRSRGAGHLTGKWVTADEAYGQLPSFRDSLDAEGYHYMLEVPCTTSMFTHLSKTEVPQWSGHGRKPTRVRLVKGEPQPQTVQALSATEPDWKELNVSEGAQGPRRYQFAAQRVWESIGGLPGRESWMVMRRNLDGSELKYYLSNAPQSTPLLTLGRVGAMRWPIETEFQTEKGETGLDEYEVRSWDGWHHHITLALLAGVFLLSVQQDWGEKDAPTDAAPSEPSAQRIVAPAGMDTPRAIELALRHPKAQ